MTVPSEQSSIQYDADGVSVSFPVPFRFIQDQHLRVTLLHAGVETVLVLGSDYSVAGANDPAGGSVTTTVAYPPGDSLTIERIVPITQETHYQRNDPFPERAHEQALDKLTMISQQIASVFGMTPGSRLRALLVPFGESIGLLPRQSARAGSALGFDANGDPVAIPSTLPEVVDAVERAEAAAVSAEEDADIAEAAAASAEADANRAETAAEAANLASGVYPDTDHIINGGDGFEPVPEGHFAITPSQYEDGFLDLYQVVSGVAVYVDTYPNKNAVDEAIRELYGATQLWRSMGFGRQPSEGFGPQWVDSVADDSGGVLTGIDERGRLRGTFEPADQYTRMPSEGFDDRPTIDTTNARGDVVSRFDEQGLYRAAMCPDDQLTRMPSEGFGDDQALANRSPDSGVFSYYDNNGKLRGVFVPDDDVSRYPSEGFVDEYVFVEIDRVGRIFAVYPQESGGGGLPPLGPTAGPYFEIDTATQSIAWSWRASASEMIRLRWQPNGYNDLFNFRGRDRAYGNDPAAAVWDQRFATNSDAVGPKIIEAAVGDDAPYGAIYTGGNHGSTGSAGGLRTARMTEWEVTVDGRVLALGETFTGYADLVEVRWVNELMAFNTIGLTAQDGRYVWRQEVIGRPRVGGLEIIENDNAMPGETVSVRMDNFTQSFVGGAGYDDTAHFYDGQQGGPFPYVPNENVSAGPKNTNPSWAAVFIGEDGIHAVWGDRQYEAGDGRYLRGSVGYFRLSGQKSYANIVGGGGAPYATFSDGAGYSMRGGYSYGLAADAEDITDVFLIPRREQLYLAYSLASAGSGRAHVPEFYVNRTATGGQLIGPSGVAVSASGYTTATIPLEIIK